jgi:hypothetical protein
MKEAVDRVIQLGQSVLETHRRASDKAEEAACRWQLEERLVVERDALLRLVDHVRPILQSMEACRQALHADAINEEELQRTFNHCSDTIESQLPGIETLFVTVRQAAQDLLLWTQRAGRIDNSSLPAEYRASYAALIAYAPVFKPSIASLQEDLLQWDKNADLHPHTHRLISMINRYNAVADSARGFVGSVVQPPLELVFHETQSFLEDFQSLPAEQMTRLATELNDCCQLLLYDSAEFRRRVVYVQPRLANGIDSSMVVLTASDGFRVIFTVDEDPLFEQLVITLLRVLPEDQLASATDNLTRVLYEHFSSE